MLVNPPKALLELADALCREQVVFFMGNFDALPVGVASVGGIP